MISENFLLPPTWGLKLQLGNLTQPTNTLSNFSSSFQIIMDFIKFLFQYGFYTISLMIKYNKIFSSVCCLIKTVLTELACEKSVNILCP